LSRVGIVACQVLERELAYLLNMNDDINVVSLRRTDQNRRFSNMLENKEIVYVNDPCFLRINCPGTEVHVEIMPAALHTDLQELEVQCHEMVDLIKQNCNSILLFFGLCGNALKSVFYREDARIVPISDENGNLVDDCIVASLGKEQYMDNLRKTGSFFLTRGWIEHWDSIVQKLEGPKREIHFKKMLEMNDYKRMLYICQGNLDSSESIGASKTLSSDMDLPLISANGRMDLFSTALSNAIKSSKERRIYKAKGSST